MGQNTGHLRTLIFQFGYKYGPNKAGFISNEIIFPLNSKQNLVDFFLEFAINTLRILSRFIAFQDPSINTQTKSIRFFFRWSIRARVTKKTEIRTWGRRGGRVFSVDLVKQIQIRKR